MKTKRAPGKLPGTLFVFMDVLIFMSGQAAGSTVAGTAVRVSISHTI